ncbi:hypothetical protein [Streptomyces olivaceoviridis]|uniref:hypothetical protein n=1 Tax=Streptomyces olivaceoviridis TaxID=1921 RepID=UPI00379177EA
MAFVTRSKKAPEGAPKTRIGYAAPKGTEGNRVGLRPPEGYVPSGPVAKGRPPQDAPKGGTGTQQSPK